MDLSDTLKVRLSKVILAEDEFDPIFEERVRAFRSFRGRAGGHFDRKIEDILAQMDVARNLEKRIGAKVDKLAEVDDWDEGRYVRYLDEYVLPDVPANIPKAVRDNVIEHNRLVRGFISHISEVDQDYGGLSLDEYTNHYFAHLNNFSIVSIKADIRMLRMGIKTEKTRYETARSFFRVVNIFRHLLYSQIIGIHGKGLERDILSSSYRATLLEIVAIPITGLTALAQIHKMLETKSVLREDPSDVFAKFENQKNAFNTYLVEYHLLLRDWVNHMTLLLPTVNTVLKQMKARISFES